jgi:hypothetical protein
VFTGESADIADLSLRELSTAIALATGLPVTAKHVLHVVELPAGFEVPSVDTAGFVTGVANYLPPRQRPTRQLLDAIRQAGATIPS